MIKDSKRTIDWLLKAIKEKVQNEVETVYDEKMKELIKQLNSEKNQIVSGILLDVMKTIKFEQRSEDIVFIIKEIKR